MGWIRKLLGLPMPCQHEWETIDTQSIARRIQFTERYAEVGRWYVLRCKKCGDIKSRREQL